MPLLLLIGVFAAAWRYYRQGGRAVIFGFGCMILLALPVLGFFRMYYHRFSLVADHRHYQASIATIALTLGGATHLCSGSGQNGRLAGILAAVLVVSTLGALTFNRAVTFGTQRALFGSDVALYPLSSGVQFTDRRISKLSSRDSTS